MKALMSVVLILLGCWNLAFSAALVQAADASPDAASANTGSPAADTAVQFQPRVPLPTQSFSQIHRNRPDSDSYYYYSAGDSGFGSDFRGALEWGYVVDGSYQLALGGWQSQPAAMMPDPELDIGQSSIDNTGVYLLAQKNWGKSFATFLQFGQVDDRLNQYENYYGAGIKINNLWRTSDGLGLKLAQAQNSLPDIVLTPDQGRAETALELSYSTPVVDFLNLQTSLYYIHTPSLERRVDNTLVIGTRAYVEF